MLRDVVFELIVVPDFSDIVCGIAFVLLGALVMVGFSDFSVMWYVLVVVGTFVVVGILVVVSLITKEFELLYI